MKKIVFQLIPEQNRMQVTLGCIMWVLIYFQKFWPRSHPFDFSIVQVATEGSQKNRN